MRGYTRKLPESWLSVVSDNSLVPIAESDLPHVAGLVWGLPSRKKHDKDNSAYSITYQELAAKFERGRGVEILNASGYLDVSRTWTKGSKGSKGATRRFKQTSLALQAQQQFIDLVTGEGFWERHTANKEAQPAPTSQGNHSAFRSKDAGGSDSKSKHAPDKWQAINVDGLRDKAKQRSEESVAESDPDKRDHYMRVAMSSAQLAECAAENGGCLLMHYIEGLGGRLFTEGLSLQNVPSETMHCALDGCYDYDVVSCYPTIYSLKAYEFGISTPALNEYLKDPGAFRVEVAKQIKCNPAQVKPALLALQHYAGIEGVISASSKPDKQTRQANPLTEKQAKSFLNHPKVKRLTNEFKRIGKHWIDATAAKRGRAFVNSFGKGISRDLLKDSRNAGSLVSHLLQGVESEIMEVIREYHKDQIVLIMHDGLVCREQINIPFMERAIERITGYQIRLKETQILAETGVFKRTGPKGPQPACSLALRPLFQDPVSVNRKGGCGGVGACGSGGGFGLPSLYLSAKQKTETFF